MKKQNQIQQFHSAEFGSLEILMINSKPYFPAIECASLLGYTNPQKAIRDHCNQSLILPICLYIVLTMSLPAHMGTRVIYFIL